MAETYCGKSCTECAQKEILNCPGCKAGPGRQDQITCELARCCTGKGHQTCETCGFGGNCNMLRSRHRMPEYRRKKQEAEAAHNEAIAKRAPFLGKWLWLLFWVLIMAEIAELLQLDVFSSVPLLYIPGRIIDLLCPIAHVVVLFMLGSEEEEYKKAGIFTLIGYALSILNTYVLGNIFPVEFNVYLVLILAIITFLGSYKTYTAHINVLTGVNDGLAQNWGILFKCHIGLICVSIIGVLLLFVSLTLGSLVTVLTGIGTLAVAVCNLVFLFQTAKVFKEYTSAEPV